MVVGPSGTQSRVLRPLMLALNLKRADARDVGVERQEIQVEHQLGVFVELILMPTAAPRSAWPTTVASRRRMRCSTHERRSGTRPP